MLDLYFSKNRTLGQPLLSYIVNSFLIKRTNHEVSFLGLFAPRADAFSKNSLSSRVIEEFKIIP